MTANKKKVIFIIPSLVPGGAERVISFVAQNIDKQKFEPLLLVAGHPRDTAYDVSNVKVKYLKKNRILTALPFIAYVIFKIKPAIVISSISHTNIAMSLIAPYFRKTIFVGRESTVLSERKTEKKPRKWSLINLVTNGFKNLDMIICQSQDMSEDLINNYDVPKEKTYVINNPISNLPTLKFSVPTSNIKRFITVGRLVEVKGHLRVLEMLSKLDILFSYTIIGDGNLKKEIFQKAKELSILKYIKHIPFTNKVNDHIAEHDLFLQGSYVEGFPNALLESCVVGTPVLAFNVPGGTKEIVEDGVNGFLVQDEEEFIKRLKDNREWNPEKVRASVYKKFNKEKIIGDYEQLFIDILK